MKNLDALQKKKNETLQKMMQALKDNDAENFNAAFNEFAESTQDAILADAHELFESHDAAVLAQRGVRQLTSQETEYYNKVIDAMRSPNPQQSITTVDEILPKTTVDAIFDSLTENHPLLDAINFQSTAMLTEILLSTSSGTAGWGDLSSTISKELSGAFSTISLSKKKLSAYIPISNAMLDLGPTWIDQYVRAVLSESIAVALEAAIVDGDGKSGPIGMTRKLTGDTGGVFPVKDATAITDFGPGTYGTLLNTLTQGPNNKRRAVSNVILVVNPADYFTKVFPATTPRTTDGGYNHDVFPFPTTVIQSAAAPTGKAVIGLADRYFMGLGTAKGGKIEYSDEYKFLEDQRMYRVKLYGDGRALDENAFVLLDISGVQPTVQEVTVKDIKSVVKTKEQA